MARDVRGEVGLLEGEQGDGDVVFIVVISVVWMWGFSLRTAEDSLPERVMASVSVEVSFLVVLLVFRSQQHGPSDLSHWHPVFLLGRSEEPSVKVSSHVTNILREVSMPALWRVWKADISSLEIHDVQEVDFMTQMKDRWRTGRREEEARWAMSRRMGRVNVTPVEPAIRRTESKAAKSDWEPP